jgi:hypothetical protein
MGGNPGYPWSIGDITALKHLKKLRVLDLGCNEIANIEPLGQLTSLFSLQLNNNIITDINELAKMADLTILDLRHNLLKNIHALRSLSKLKIAGLCNNKINELQLDDIENLNLFLNLSPTYNYDYEPGNLYLHGNMIGNIPSEVLHQGGRFIIQFFKAQAEVLPGKPVYRKDCLEMKNSIRMKVKRMVYVKGPGIKE